MKIIVFLTLLSFFINSHAEELKITQKVEITISNPKTTNKVFSKTMMLNEPTQFDIGPYRFHINGEQIEKKDQAMVETKISKKNESGEYKALYNPTLMVMFKKQAQYKTEDGDTTIDFRTIVERQIVSNQ